MPSVRLPPLTRPPPAPSLAATHRNCRLCIAEHPFVTAGSGYAEHALVPPGLGTRVLQHPLVPITPLRHSQRRSVLGCQEVATAGRGRHRPPPFAYPQPDTASFTWLLLAVQTHQTAQLFAPFRCSKSGVARAPADEPPPHQTLRPAWHRQPTLPLPAAPLPPPAPPAASAAQRAAQSCHRLAIRQALAVWGASQAHQQSQTSRHASTLGAEGELTLQLPLGRVLCAACISQSDSTQACFLRQGDQTQLCMHYNHSRAGQ